MLLKGIHKRDAYSMRGTLLILIWLKLPHLYKLQVKLKTINLTGFIPNYVVKFVRYRDSKTNNE